MKIISVTTAIFSVICSILNADESAKPKEKDWEQIVDRCDFGATYEMKSDRALHVSMAKSSSEDIYCFRSTRRESPSVALLLVRYYSIGDETVDRGSTAKVEVYKINFESASGEMVFRLNEDGEWIAAAEKIEIASRARAIFMAVSDHQKRHN